MVDEFAAALRTASLHCQLGGELDGRLRDLLIVGLRSEPIRKRIMERDDITFSKALKFAADLDRISREAKLGSSNEASVSRVMAALNLHTGSRSFGNQQQTTSSSSSSGPSQGGGQGVARGVCWGSGDMNHRKNDCPYVTRSLTCYECGKTGHKAKA